MTKSGRGNCPCNRDSSGNVSAVKLQPLASKCTVALSVVDSKKIKTWWRTWRTYRWNRLKGQNDSGNPLICHETWGTKMLAYPTQYITIWQRLEPWLDTRTLFGQVVEPLAVCAIRLWVFPHHPLAEKRAYVRKWTEKRTMRKERSSSRSPCRWPNCCARSAAGFGWRASGVVLSPCGGWPKDQEDGDMGVRLLPSECQGSRWGCRRVSAASWPEVRRVSVDSRRAKAAWAAICLVMRRVVRWGCKAVNAAGAAGCPELRNNVFTPAGDETVVQMWSVLFRTLRRIPVCWVCHARV